MKAPRPITVLIVDDHPLLREGITAVLQGEDDFLIVGQATNGKEAAESFRLHRPDVTLMDLQMPIQNGIETIREIRKDFPDARFVILTTYQGDVQALNALKAGATGYLLKSTLRNDLLDTIRAVHLGKKSIPPEIAAQLAAYVTQDALSEREIEVLKRVATGTSNKSIASQMSLSEATVKSHMQNILAKLEAKDRTHAVTIAMKRGFLDG